MEEVTETKEVTQTMMEFLQLKVNCAAIVACNVIGDFEKDKALNKIGNRAIKVVDDTIGDDIEILEKRLEEIDGLKEKESMAEGFDGSFSKEVQTLVKDYNKIFEAAWNTKGTMQYDPVVVSTKRADGRDFSAGFPAQKVIGFRKQTYNINPYDAFFALMDEEKQFIK
jgi:hypothetical protein